VSSNRPFFNHGVKAIPGSITDLSSDILNIRKEKKGSQIGHKNVLSEMEKFPFYFT